MDLLIHMQCTWVYCSTDMVTSPCVCVCVCVCVCELDYYEIPWICIAFVKSLSHIQLFVTPWVATGQDSLSSKISQSPPKFIAIESVMPSNHLILCHLLLLPSIIPSIRVFSSESALHIKGARRSNQSILKESTLSIHWIDWCWSWSSNTLAIWCNRLAHCRRPWCWERLKAKEEGGRGWDG